MDISGSRSRLRFLHSGREGTGQSMSCFRTAMLPTEMPEAAGKGTGVLVGAA